MLINYISSSHSPNSNCENDNADMLLDLISMLESSDNPTEDTSPQIICFEEQTELEIINYPTTNKSRSVTACNASLICKKLLNLCNNCNNCKLDLLSVVPRKETHTGETHQENLFYPSQNFFQIFESTHKILVEIIPKLIHMSKLTNLLEKEISHMSFEWMQCKEHEMQIKTKFLELICMSEIKYFCKTINNILSGKIITRNYRNHLFKYAFIYREKHSKKRR